MSGSTMLEAQIKALKELRGKEVQTGWFESDKYADGTSTAYVARIVNFGCVVKQNGITIIIPARPFMQKAYANFVSNRKKLENGLAKKLIEGKITPEQALAQIGMAMEGCIVESIRDGEWIPNAASTIAKKGFDKPLIDSAHMWQTVNSKVS